MSSADWGIWDEIKVTNAILLRIEKTLIEIRDELRERNVQSG